MIPRRLSRRHPTTKRRSSAFILLIVLACACAPKTESETTADTTFVAQATVPPRDSAADAAMQAKIEADERDEHEAIAREEEALRMIDIVIPSDSLRPGSFAEYSGDDIDPAWLLIAPPVGTEYGLFKSPKSKAAPEKTITAPFFTQSAEPVSNEDNPDCNSRSWWSVSYDGSTGWVLPDLEGAYKILELNVGQSAFEFPGIGKVRVGLTGYYEISYSEGEGTQCMPTQMLVLYDSKRVYFVECLENNSVYKAKASYDAAARYAEVAVKDNSFNCIGDRLHLMQVANLEGIQMEGEGMLVYFNLSSGTSMHFTIRWTGDHFVADSFFDSSRD